MKKNHLFLTIATAFSLFPGAAGAIDRPADSSGSPSGDSSPDLTRTVSSSAASEGEALKPIPARVSELWLGIVPGQVPAVLLAQLEMNANPGVVVESTAPGSPARKAGIMDMDIVLRVADRAISGPEDLKLALQGHQAGDKVPVELLRGGKKQTVSVELAEAKNAGRRAGNARHMIDRAIGAGKTPLPLNNASGADDPFALLQGLMSGMDQGGIFPDDDLMNDAFNGGVDPASAIANMRRMMAQRMQRGSSGINSGMQGIPGMGMPGGVQQSSMSRSTIRFSDGDGEIAILGNGKETRVEVYDRNGKLLFEGPYTTDEDKNNVPSEIKARLNRVHMGR